MKEVDLQAVARYLEGGMEMQEMIAFESKIKNSPELQQAVESYRNSRISRTAEPVVAPVSKAVVPAKPTSIKGYVFAVVIVLLIISGVVFWIYREPGLYSKYAISRQMEVPKGSSEAQKNIAKGAVLYNAGKYAEARKFLQGEYMLNPQNPMLSYYFAITLVETGKEYEARTIFMNLFKGETAFKFDSAYFVALSFLKEGDKAAAKEWLSKVPTADRNHSKAVQLINELKK
jgi:tetratricopeptide (TPR) repeat protein